MKRLFAVVLAAAMLASMGGALAAVCTDGYDWTTTERPALEIVKYVKNNTVDGAVFVADDSAEAVVAELVYYAIKLTVPANVEEIWYNEAVLNDVEVDYTNLDGNSFTQYFPMPAWSDVKVGGEYYLLNSVSASTSVSGTADTASWTSAFDSSTCIWSKTVSAFPASVSATIKSDSARYNTYLSFGYTITAADGLGESDILSSLTFVQDSTGHQAVLTLDSDGSITSAAVTESGGVAASPGSEVYSSIMNDVNSIFGLNFGTKVTKAAVMHNFGWRDTIMDSVSFDGSAVATPAPELGEDVTYYDTRMLSLVNYADLDGATYKVYLYDAEQDTYVHQPSFTVTVTGDLIKIDWLGAMTNGPAHLAISATLPGCSESEPTPFRMIDTDIPAPQLDSAECYTNSPILTIVNYEELALLGDYSYRLYSRSDDGETYSYNEKMTKGLSVLSADAVRLSKDEAADFPATYPAYLAITAYVSDRAESELVEFELLQPEDGSDDEYITEVLPPDENNNSGNTDNDSSGQGNGNRPNKHRPAEIWIHGPVEPHHRGDREKPPKVHIDKIDGDHYGRGGDEGHREMHEHVPHDDNFLGAYELTLENADIAPGGRMRIRFCFPEHKGKWILIAHYDSRRGRVETYRRQLDEDGFAEIEVDSLSPFAIGLSEAPAPTPAPSGDSSYRGNPSVILPDAPQTVSLSGGRGVMRVAASNASGYQWQVNYGQGWQDIAGATGNSFTATEADAGAQFRCVIKNGYGMVYSPVFTVYGNDLTLPKTGGAPALLPYCLLLAAALRRRRSK